MFAIVEPINLLDMVDRPNLGCAMVMAACREKGVDVTLIRAQTRYIRDMFVRESEEIWNLYQNLEENETSRSLVRYKALFENKPLNRFQDELKELYDEVIANKTLRSCFNAPLVRRFLTLYNDFAGLYHYYGNHLHHTELRFVQRYVDQIVAHNPKYLGWSLRGGFDVLSRAIRKTVKEKTGMPIILGGAFTPFIDLDSVGPFFGREHFDYLIVGAGETALPDLLEALESGRPPDRIPNVVYLDGGHVRAGETEVISDLNKLPCPDFSQFDLDRYLTPVRILPIQTSRGCYWRKCAFCSHHRIDRNHYEKWRPEKVVEILAVLRERYACTHFFIEDESVSPERAGQLSNAILQRRLRVRLDIRGRFEKGFNDNGLFRLMKKAGFSAISWGLESGCQKVLNAMRKGTTKETIQAILKKASRNNIANLCFIMCGFPSETREDFHETIQFIMENNPYIDRVMSSVFEFEKHAPIGKEPEKWGIVVHGDGTISTETGMAREETAAVYEEALDRYVRFLEGKRRAAKYLVSGYDSGHIVRMIIFFIFSRLLKKEAIMAFLEGAGGGACVYPVLAGRIARVQGTDRFFPADVNRTLLDNYVAPEKERPLDTLETAMFHMADGTRNVAQIIRALQGKGLAVPDGTPVHEKAAAFYKEIFSRDWGVALGQKI